MENWRWSNKARMTVTDADIVEYGLLSTATDTNCSINILEWGSGKSTVYFTNLLNRLNINFNWVALEHNRQFFNNFLYPHLMGSFDIDILFIENDNHSVQKTLKNDEVRFSSDKSVRIIVFDKGLVVPHKKVEDRLVDLDEYIYYPSLLLNVRLNIVNKDKIGYTCWYGKREANRTVYRAGR